MLEDASQPELKPVDQALRDALAGGGPVSVSQMYAILEATLANHGVTRTDRADLRNMLAEVPAVDPMTRTEIVHWLDRCDRVAGRLFYSKVRRGYGQLPSGWIGSRYDTGEAGRCAIRVSMCLHAAGMSFAGFPWQFLWKGELPIYASELASFLAATFGAGEQVNRNSVGMNVRQGILFIEGGWGHYGRPVGHITLWNGKACEDATRFDADKGAAACQFWDLRPDWLVS